MSSERGAVTAEFMLLLPALSALAALAIAGFGLGLSRIALEVEVFQVARAAAIGLELPDNNGLEIFFEGRLKCVELTKPGILPLQAKACVLAYGS